MISKLFKSDEDMRKLREMITHLMCDVNVNTMYIFQYAESVEYEVINEKIRNTMCEMFSPIIKVMSTEELRKRKLSDRMKSIVSTYKMILYLYDGKIGSYNSDIVEEMMRDGEEELELNMNEIYNDLIGIDMDVKLMENVNVKMGRTCLILCIPDNIKWINRSSQEKYNIEMININVE